MPNARTSNAARREFEPGSVVQSNLSGAACTSDWLWVAGDEACGLDRLRLVRAYVCAEVSEVWPARA